MREIKFRGQRADTKEWVYGFYYFGRIPFDISFKQEHFIINEYDGFVPVIPKTVSQYKGVKDKNGVEIY